MQVKGLLEESVALAVQQGGAEAQDSALQQAQVVAERLQEKHATEQCIDVMEGHEGAVWSVAADARTLGAFLAHASELMRPARASP